MLEQVRQLSKEKRFDYLLIESTGISEPLPVATTFDFRDENEQSLSDVSRLDTMVIVVDAANLIKNYSSTDFLKDKGEVAGEADERTLVDLLVEQIFSTVKWRESIIYMSNEGVKNFIEIGPGKALSGMVKRTIKNSKSFSINSITDMKNLENEFKR